jgi:hypothetical protein
MRTLFLVVPVLLLSLCCGDVSSPAPSLCGTNVAVVCPTGKSPKLTADGGPITCTASPVAEAGGKSMFCCSTSNVSCN